MRSRSFATNAIITAVTNLLLAGIGLLTSMLAARILGVNGRGELAAIQLWPNLIATIAMLGLSESLVYHSARDRDHSAHYAATAILLALSAGGVFVGVGYFAMPWLLGRQSAEVVSAARWYLSIVPVFAIAGLPYHILRGRGDFVAWNAIRTTPNIAWLIVLISSAALGVTSARSVAAGYLWSTLLLGLGIGYFVIRRVPGSYMPRLGDVRPLLRYGVPSMTTTGPNLLAARLDQMLLVAFFSPTMLGLYVVALGWASAVSPFLSAIASVTFPRVAGTIDINIRNAGFARAVRMSVIAACVAVIPITLLAPLMVPLLFGADFSQAVTASILLTIGAAVTGVNQVLEEGLRGVGRPASILWAQAAGLPVTVLAMLVLLPVWGLEGASVAVVAGTVTMCVVLLRVAQGITNISIMQFCLPTIEDIRMFIVHGKHVLLKRSFTRNR